MIENRMVNDKCWPREKGEEWYDARDTRADQIADDLWLVEVARQIREATIILKQSNDEAEHD